MKNNEWSSPGGEEWGSWEWKDWTQRVVVLLNFAHPTTELQVNQIRDFFQADEVKEIRFNVHFDVNAPFNEQITDLTRNCYEAFEETYPVFSPYHSPVVLNLPSLAVIAVMLVRSLSLSLLNVDYILRLKPTHNLEGFEVAELIRISNIKRISNDK